MLTSTLTHSDFYRRRLPAGASLYGHIKRISNPLEVVRPPVHPVALVAVNALDELVSEIVKKHKHQVRADFLDWVADEVTPELERLARKRFGKRTTDGHVTAQDTRNWVWQVCLPRLEQKIQGLDSTIPQTDLLHSSMQIDILLDELATT